MSACGEAARGVHCHVRPQLSLDGSSMAQLPGEMPLSLLEGSVNSLDQIPASSCGQEQMPARGRYVGIFLIHHLLFQYMHGMCFIYWPAPLAQNYLPKAWAASIQNRYHSLPLLMVGEQVHQHCGKTLGSLWMTTCKFGCTRAVEGGGSKVVKEGYAYCWADSKLRGTLDTDESWTGL